MEFVKDSKGLYHGRLGRYYWGYAHVPPLWPSMIWGRVGDQHVSFKGVLYR